MEALDAKEISRARENSWESQLEGQEERLWMNSFMSPSLPLPPF